MPYALFENDDQLSRPFATEAEAWKHADDAGLVSDHHGKPALEDNYVIKPCPETIQWKWPPATGPTSRTGNCPA